jgi:transitional endoplasmic reticulum ATPase
MSKDNTDDKLNAEAKAFKQRLDILLARGRIADAIRYLDKSSRDGQLSLFESKSELDARRRMAWLYKINLLRSVGRSREALAWACLESELNPDNVDAHAMKQQLKKRLGLLPEDNPGRGNPCPTKKDDRWTGVAGMRELKAVLERDVILPLEQPELYKKYRVSLPNGILLYGPPGCGKTFIAQKLGRILGFHFAEIKPSDLGSIYVHGTQEKIGQLFSKAREKAPCLLFFDELDALLPTRSGDVGHHYAAEVNEFLTHLNKAAEHRVLVVGATNRLDKIDSAALRPGRFDKKIFVGQPDLEARTQLLKLYMADRPQEKIDFVAMGRECEGYTCAELEHIVNESARRALERRRSICKDDLLAALAKYPPAHAEEKPTEGDAF